MLAFSIAYLGIGLFAGVLAGLLGVGGGLVIVPALVMLFAAQGFSADIVVHLAVGTSLLTIIATGASSTWAHDGHGAVDWPLFGQLALGLVPGAVAGGLLAAVIPAATLQGVVAVYVLVVAVQVLAGLKPAAHRELPGRLMRAIAGAVIGAVSAVVGIGGGSLTVPWLLWHNVSMPRAVATSSACGVPLAAAGALAFVVAGWGQPLLPEGASGYVYWPAAAGIVLTSLLTAPLGARLAHTLPIPVLKRLFGVFLLLVAAKMLLG